MLGGVGFVVASLMTWLCTPHCPKSSAYFTLASFAVLAASAMAALVSLHITQREIYGLLGTLAFLTAFTGVAMIMLDLLRSLVVVVSQGSPGAAGVSWLLIFGLLVATVGLLAYGVATMTAGALPWWCGAALIAGSPLVGLFLQPLSPVEDLQWGVPWVLVGYAIFRAKRRLQEQSSHVY